MIHSLILVLLLLPASATATMWTAFSSDGLMVDQQVTLPEGFFFVDVAPSLPGAIDFGATDSVTGEVVGHPCVNIIPNLCGPNRGSVTINGILYQYGDADHNVAWNFLFDGSVSVPSELSGPTAVITGPATLTGTYTIFDHGLASRDFTLDLTGTLSMELLRGALDGPPSYHRHSTGTIAAADFPDAVPEPGTWLLLVTGLGVLVIGRYSASSRFRC